MDIIEAQFILRDLLKNKSCFGGTLDEALKTLSGEGRYRNGASCPVCSSVSKEYIAQHGWKTIKCDCCGSTYDIRQIPLFEVRS